VNLKPSIEQGEESNKGGPTFQGQHSQYPCQSGVGEGESDCRHGGARMRPRRSAPRSGFTLLEMLAVMFIIAILATMMTSVVGAGRRQARQTDCKSNLRQMGVAILVYRGEHNGANPLWLSNLYPDYLDDKRVFVCRSDKRKGVGVIRPTDLPSEVTENDVYNLFPNVIDNKYRDSRWLTSQNTNVLANSYFYEFSDAVVVTGWNLPIEYDLDGDPNVTRWWEYKEDQLRFGSKGANGGTHEKPAPYSQSRLPIVRCYHHHGESRIPAYANEAALKAKGQPSQERIAINVAYAGNVYVGPLWWEGMLEPEEPFTVP
jgi:prepilin-type N-terminal cleavage/methylation domain-containing protein